MRIAGLHGAAPHAVICHDGPVIDRLSPADSSFLYLEEAHTPTHVGQVLIFDAPADYDTHALSMAISARVERMPRYRQRVHSLPGRVVSPVWVDDTEFDLDYHVRRSALPAPGDRAQLQDFVARVCARPLDRHRPLWEVYVVEGLDDGRIAVISKVHQALIESGDITGLSSEARAQDAPGAGWTPTPGPSARELLSDTAISLVKRPGSVVGTVRGGLAELRATAGRVGRVAGTVAKAAARPASGRTFAVESAGARRYLMVDGSLADLREVRKAMSTGGHKRPSLHAVALTVVTGGLRIWLQSRGEHVPAQRSVRAMVPVSVARDGTPYGSTVEALFIDLPVGESSPAMRLRQIQFALDRQLAQHSGVRAADLMGMAGFAPPALHSLGVRVGASLSTRLFDLVITNVPGPQRQMYADGLPLVASYPVLPLTKGHAMAIGMTSYLGAMHYGVLADREAIPDLDQLRAAIAEAVEELLHWVADPFGTEGN